MIIPVSREVFKNIYSVCKIIYDRHSHEYDDPRPLPRIEDWYFAMEEKSHAYIMIYRSVFNEDRYKSNFIVKSNQNLELQFGSYQTSEFDRYDWNNVKFTTYDSKYKSTTDKFDPIRSLKYNLWDSEQTNEIISNPPPQLNTIDAIF